MILEFEEYWQTVVGPIQVKYLLADVEQLLKQQEKEKENVS